MSPKFPFHSLSQKLLFVLAAIVLMFGALPVLPSYAAGSIAVNTTVDENTSNGSCSLREAIIAANNNASYNGCNYSGTGPDDVITLQSGSTYPLTIAGLSSTTGDLDIGNAGGTSGNLTIMASGGTNAIIDASAIVNRVIEVGAPGDTSLTLDHITVMNGQASPGAGILFGGNGTLTLNNSKVSNNTSDSPQNCGAGIFNNTSAAINIINSTIESNTCTDISADGGGLFKGTGGTLTVTASTFNNNTTPDDGGGIRLLLAAGTVTITNSTFANNAAARGGGIQVEGGTVTIAFSTFSGNAANLTPGPNTGGAVQAAAGAVEISNSILANSTTNAAVGKDCDQAAPGTVNLTSSLVENNNDCTGTGNLTADPQLGSLQNNSGPTKTMLLGASSPAIDAASDGSCPLTDQRGITRPYGSHCDMGAYELAPTFVDVPADHLFWEEIEVFYNAGITTGCSQSPKMYCPNANVTRAEMATFIERALGNFNPSPNPTGMFADVPYPGLEHLTPFIEQFYNDGLTTGCAGGPLRYCPQNLVTRQEMAAFIVRAFNLPQP